MAVEERSKGLARLKGPRDSKGLKGPKGQQGQRQEIEPVSVVFEVA